MKKFLFALALILCASPAFAAKKESAYDRIMRTNTINCGYYIWPPFMIKDPNTGKMSGVAYDIMEEIGAQLNLKINWATEINFDAMFEGYNNGRYDMICAPVNATPARARASDFTAPLFYSAYYLYAKAGDTRFDNAYEKANKPEIKYGQFDGEYGAILGKQEFPLSQKISLPQLATSADLMLSLATGKVDFIATEPGNAQEFINKNPGKVKRVAGDPIQVIPVSLSVPIGEEKLKALMNTSVYSLIDTGFIEKALKQSPLYDETLLRVKRSYEVKK